MVRSVHVGLIAAVLVLLFIVSCLTGCTSSPTAQTPASPAPATKTADNHTLIIATETGLYETGFLDYLQSIFESKYNIKLKLIAKGTTKAIEMAKNGDVDILLINSPSQELDFMTTGYGLNRRSFASNYLLIVGPPDDPAGIANMPPENAFTTLYKKGTGKTPNIYFVSRGDGSGIQVAERKIWAGAKYNYAKTIENSGDWYSEAGKDMEDTLLMANEKGAYTLTDEKTYLEDKSKITLVPLISRGQSLLQIYSVMASYHDQQPEERIRMANDFINFLLSPETQTAIGSYGTDQYGKSLFTPINVSVPEAPAYFVGDHTSPATDLKPA
jgi:tungstate transport system substrate-binding protein